MPMLFSIGLGRTDRRRSSMAALGCLSMPIRVVSRSAHVAGLVILRQTFVRGRHRWQFDASLEAGQQAQLQGLGGEWAPAVPTRGPPLASTRQHAVGVFFGAAGSRALVPPPAAQPDRSRSWTCHGHRYRSSWLRWSPWRLGSH